MIMILIYDLFLKHNNDENNKTELQTTTLLYMHLAVQTISNNILLNQC